MKGTYIELQRTIIEAYGITINECSSCKGRMHAHVKSRSICKWKPKNSVRATFDLFHELGHIETYTTGLRRCESEYHATKFAIDLCRINGVTIPESIIELYQNYIYLELDRGIRHHGKYLPDRSELKLKGWC